MQTEMNKKTYIKLQRLQLLFVEKQKNAQKNYRNYRKTSHHHPRRRRRRRHLFAQSITVTISNTAKRQYGGTVRQH